MLCYKKTYPTKEKMKITVFREACCSQDDQVGPLEAAYDVEPNESFASLIQRVIQSSFLQFTSSHSGMTGAVDGTDVVELFSVYDEKAGQIEFKVNPNAPIAELLNGNALSFYFHRHRGNVPNNVG
jgi:hypothetical protein